MNSEIERELNHYALLGAISETETGNNVCFNNSTEWERRGSESCATHMKQ